MRKFILLNILLVLTSITYAQIKQISEVDYRRNSLYSLMISDTTQRYDWRIRQQFLEIPTPDKYNDSDLSVKFIMGGKRKVKQRDVEEFLTKNNIASHLVANWFNRDPFTGICNLEKVKSRGLYSASESDKLIASYTVRGKSKLEDSGEDLIANTFVIVNYIHYEDKEKQGEIAGIILGILFSAAQATGNAMGYNTGNTDWGQNMMQLMQTLKGFKVKISTQLYRLEWNEEIAYEFFSKMYTEKPDVTKKKYFETHRNIFKLTYVGEQRSSGSEVSFLGVNLDEPSEMIRKAVARAIDENIANLQKNFESFKVKVPLSSIAPLSAQIGKKEGVTEKSVYEVLEPQVKENGKIVYKRVGTVKPIKGIIWDNRYMAAEEGADGSTIGYTAFKKITGDNFTPGMLLREIK